jgi:hypothetical protein
MKTYHPKIITQGSENQQSVVLSLTEWESIVQDLEELDDIHNYDKAKNGPSDCVAFSQAVHEIQQDYK